MANDELEIAAARAAGFTTPDGDDWIRDGDNAITNNAKIAQRHIGKLTDEMSLRARADKTGENEITLAWERETTDYVTNVVGNGMIGDPKKLTTYATVPYLTAEKISTKHLPKQETIITETVKTKEVLLGDRVKLNFIYGNGGDRIQLIGQDGVTPAPMPYFEVAAAREGTGSDIGGAIGGYQAHWIGNGTTPSNQDRLYWGVELLELSKKYFGREDLAGAVQIFVSSRNNVPLRAMIFAASARPALIFHAAKPYMEIARNTGLIQDDRQYPTATPGTLLGVWTEIYRREGGVGTRLAAYTDSGHAQTFKSRNRGTVEAASLPQAGDVLGQDAYGATLNTDVDYVHEQSRGGQWKNGRAVGADVLVTARENWRENTGYGAKIALRTAAPGETALRESAAIQEPTAPGETALLLRVNKDGTTSQVPVKIGAPNSGGTGYRALIIDN